MKNSSDNIGNRTRDLPACSAVVSGMTRIIINYIMINQYKTSVDARASKT